MDRSAAISRPPAPLTTPNGNYWVRVSPSERGLRFNYVVIQDECAAELHIDRGKASDAENKSIFDQLSADKQQIEELFGGELSWEHRQRAFQRSAVKRSAVKWVEYPEQ